MKILDLKYNVPCEVSKKQYNKSIVEFAGVIAHRVCNEGKYWIILWMPKYKKQLINYLTQINQDETN